MPATGRGLMTNPRLLILDEATDGPAPPMQDEIDFGSDAPRPGIDA